MEKKKILLPPPLSPKTYKRKKARHLQFSFLSFLKKSNLIASSQIFWEHGGTSQHRSLSVLPSPK
jgi:hypothetical protein